MSEEEINYASVVFKTSKRPPPEAKKEEETVYDEVKVRSETTEQTANSNDKRANNRRRRYQHLAFCLGILCVMLLAGIIAVGVFLATLSHESDVRELNQLKENQTTLLAANLNLTNLNDKLSSESEKLRRDHNNLTVQFDSLTQAYTVLEIKTTGLTAENQQLKTQNQQLKTQNQELETQNQELETEKNNLTEQIRDMETNWNELNVSRAQWSIDAYCLINNNKMCTPCQKGWQYKKHSCYAINNAVPADQKTWEKAREDCRKKKSDFTVIHDRDEKKIVNDFSWQSSGNKGYWIGLRVVDGKWKWIDGSELTISSWIQAPSDGHCAISVEDVGWKSVRCDTRQQWICKKEALSV